jgi:Tfp pilus assembly protein PilX
MSPRREERGSALLIALVIITVLGLVLGAMLGFLDSSFRTTVVVNSQRDQVYAAEGAVRAAVDRIRTDLARGNDGDSACGYSTPASFANGQQVNVTCEAFPGSGSTGTPDNRPDDAILALSKWGKTWTSGSIDEGVIQDPTVGSGGGTSNIHIAGDVASNRYLGDTGAGVGTMTVQGNVTAHSCGDVTATKVKSCPSPTVFADPAYARATDVFPAPAPAAVCMTSAVALSPGWYTSAPTAPAACAGLTRFWLQPGFYYLDFTTGAHVWDLGGKTVIGGTPIGWSPSAASPVPTLPHACKTETDPTPYAGVQVVVGGDTQIHGSTGQMELCATPSQTSQQIAVYGNPVSTTPVTPIVDQAATATSAGAGTTAPFSSPSNATSIDGTEAAASLSGTATSATINLLGYPALPAGSLIESVKLRVKHRESATNGLQLTVTGASGRVLSLDGSCGENNLCQDPAPHENTFDITGLFSDNPSTLTGLMMSYKATRLNSGSPTADAWLDGAVLEVTLSPAPGSFRAVAGCGRSVIAPCSLLNTDASSGGVLYLQGTLYAPTAAVDAVTGVGDPVSFNRGVIARTILLKIHPGSGSATVAGFGGFARRLVELTASIGPKAIIKAFVLLDDSDTSSPGAKVRYLSWDVQRS